MRSTILAFSAICSCAALGGCNNAPQQDACAASGYDQNVCADEQSRRAAALGFLAGMRQNQPAPYQLPPVQPYYVPPPPVSHTTQCNSTPNYAGGFSTTCQ